MSGYAFTKLPSLDLASIYSDEKELVLWGDPLGASIIHDTPLVKQDVKIQMLPEPFHLNRELAELEDPFISFLEKQFPGKKFSNGKTVRLQDMRNDGDRLVLYLQNASYFQYLVTGWAAAEGYAVQNGQGKPIPIRHLVEPGPALSFLSESKASNHVGVGALLLCEGHLLMNVRSGKQMTDSNMLGLSASGVLQNEGAATSPFHHALVELHEEMGISEEDIETDATRLLGIAREFHRAGKPEMYFLFRAKHSLARMTEIVQQRKGVDAWEATQSMWIKVESERMEDLKDVYMLQPSARIGLWLLLRNKEGLTVE